MHTAISTEERKLAAFAMSTAIPDPGTTQAQLVAAAAEIMRLDDRLRRRVTAHPWDVGDLQAQARRYVAGFADQPA